MTFVVFYLTALLIGRNNESALASLFLNIFGAAACIYLLLFEMI
jgi:hypothetical protein